MLNYYEILEIPTDASTDQVKRAFRRKAKEIHPDLWQHNPEAIDSMRDLLKAYETLMDSDLRDEYDVKYRGIYGAKDFDYREFLLGRPEDAQSQSKLIFFDLLHKREKDALRLYETLVLRKQFDLSKHLDREDFMDCAFLLAEEFEEEGSFESAYHLLRTIVEYELQKPYFRHFFEEVLQRLRGLVGTKMAGKVATDEHVRYAEELVRYRISNKETAFYLKTAAELYVRDKDFRRAEYYLREALRLDKSLPGLRKIRLALAKQEK